MSIGVETVKQRILIVEDSVPQSFALRQYFSRAGYDVTAVENGLLAIEEIEKQHPDLIVSDINMPKMDGFALCSKLKKDPKTSAIPIILLTQLSEQHDVVRGLEAEADFYITRPYEPAFLLQKVQGLLEGANRPQQGPEGLIVTVEGQTYNINTKPIQILSLLLSTYENASQQNKALRIAQESLHQANRNFKERSGQLKASETNFRALLESNPDFLLVCNESGIIVYVNPAASSQLGAKTGSTARDFFEDTPNLHETRETTLQTVVGDTITVEVRCRETFWQRQSAYLFELRDITLRKTAELQIKEQQKRLEEANKKLAELATIDGLTGLKNRRVFQEKLREEIERSDRYDVAFSLVLMDVDHFKSYNDSFGHPAGDDVLVRVAQLIKDQTRQSDLAARYGGEEFAMILPFTGYKEAIHIADRIRSVIACQEFEHRPVTASFGIATMDKTLGSDEEMIKRADEALYRSKAEGRNRVNHYQDLNFTAE